MNGSSDIPISLLCDFSASNHICLIELYSFDHVSKAVGGGHIVESLGLLGLHEISVILGWFILFWVV